MHSLKVVAVFVVGRMSVEAQHMDAAIVTMHQDSDAFPVVSQDNSSDAFQCYACTVPCKLSECPHRYTKKRFHACDCWNGMMHAVNVVREDGAALASFNYDMSDIL